MEEAARSGLAAITAAAKVDSKRAATLADSLRALACTARLYRLSRHGLVSNCCDHCFTFLDGFLSEPSRANT